MGTFERFLILTLFIIHVFAHLDNLFDHIEGIDDLFDKATDKHDKHKKHTHKHKNKNGKHHECAHDKMEHKISQQNGNSFVLKAQTT